MPDYLYKCDACDTKQERTNVKIKDRDAQTCDKCAALLRKLICFRGSVWAPTAGGMR